MMIREFGDSIEMVSAQDMRNLCTHVPMYPCGTFSEANSGVSYRYTQDPLLSWVTLWIFIHLRLLRLSRKFSF